MQGSKLPPLPERDEMREDGFGEEGRGDKDSERRPLGGGGGEPGCALFGAVVLRFVLICVLLVGFFLCLSCDDDDASMTVGIIEALVGEAQGREAVMLVMSRGWRFLLLVA